MNLNDFELVVHKREGVGSKFARKMRSEGNVPVNFYGCGVSFSGYMSLLDLERAIRSKTLFNMFSSAVLDGEKYLVVAKVLQRDSVTEQILHVDFQVVDPVQSFKMKIPISYINKELCNDIKLGGILNVVLSTLILEASPEKMPAYIECDLANARAKVPIRLSSVCIPDGVTLVGHKFSDTIASISAIRKKASDVVSAADGGKTAKK